ncbi:MULTISPECIES: helix-turn-helix domain-containing protein [Leptospira]|uniref:helix-turn-helix domain-containing protein n=1 Tax=Leptospira TaxID=171 RepID=UPI001E4AE03F|nr:MULTISPECIES: helix-turn-helix transcriptional regulator [Leptospira]
MRDRLITLINLLGLNQKEFCESVNISPSRLSEVMNGRTLNLSADAMIDIMRIHRVNANWLLTGEGDIFNPITPLTGKSKAEKIATLESLRQFRKKTLTRETLDIIERKPESVELIKLLLKVDTEKYPQLKTILKSFVQTG